MSIEAPGNIIPFTWRPPVEGTPRHERLLRPVNPDNPADIIPLPTKIDPGRFICLARENHARLASDGLERTRKPNNPPEPGEDEK